jgi:O-antigen/teichoic acid export membrane protein
VQLAKLFSHLRLTPFTTDTEEGRASERYRRALLTMVVNLAARVLGLVVMVASISWTVPYLGAERFGAWMTIASFAAMLSFLDLGVGNALTNRVAHAASASKSSELQECVSGGLGLLALISFVLAALAMLGAVFLPWVLLMKLSSNELGQEVQRTVMVFSALFAAQTFANGVARVFHGLQRGFDAYFAAIAGTFCSLVMLWVAAKQQADLPTLLFAFMSGPILGNLVLLYVLWRQAIFSSYQWTRTTRGQSPHLFKVGSLFLFLQVGTMVGWGADSLIIANATGAASVAAFAVVQRLMQLVSQPLSIVNAPLWAAYADADARKDGLFITSTFKKSFSLTLAVSTAGAIFLFAFGLEIIQYWTKSEIQPSQMLIGVMAIWLVFDTCGNALAMLLNGLGIVKQQVWVLCAFVSLVFPAKLLLVPSFGAVGVVSVGLAAYFLTTVIGYGVFFRNDIKKKMQ